MKRLVALALCAMMAIGLCACGDSAASGTGAADAGAAVTGEAAAEEGEEAAAPQIDESLIAEDGINVCIASEPDNIDPALNSAVDGATLIIHTFAGIAKWEQADDGSFIIAPDCVKELVEGEENEDGTVTYTYELRDDLTWSDGEPVTADDFVFAWNRAAGPELAADYNYMFEVVDGYDEMWEADANDELVNPDAKLNVKAVDDQTLEVTLKNAVPYWNELLAFPAYMPVREDVVEDEGWATDPETYICNGPYTMKSWKHNSLITLEKNEDWYGADDVTMNELNFYLSDDANNMLTNFQNGDWQLIDDVPTNEIATLKEEDPDEFKIEGQLGTYYLSWNINANILPKDSKLTGVEAEKAQQEIRNALSLLLDRNYIVEDVAQGGQVPASSFVAMGLTDADGSEFYENAGDSKDFTGYYDVSADALEDNFDSAVETLKKYYEFDEASGKFTNFPSLTYLYNTNEGHKAIAEYVQSAFDSVGITMNLENEEWNSFLNTRKEGNFTIARNGWLGDFNDPISFLDMWTTGSGNNDIQYGKGDSANLKMYNLDLTDLGYEDIKVENGTWKDTYDVLISTIKTCTDDDARYKMMHMAEDMLMETGCIIPVYYYTDLFMLDKNVEGYFSTPLGFKYFLHCTYAE